MLMLMLIAELYLFSRLVGSVVCDMNCLALECATECEISWVLLFVLRVHPWYPFNVHFSSFAATRVWINLARQI